MPYFAKYTPKRTVRWPRGYLVPTADPAVVAKLQRRGLLVERLAERATLAVEGFRVTSLTPSERLNQGHYTNAVRAVFETTREFPAGTVFVTTAQRLAPLAASLLEAESDDGLLVWNMFDRMLSVQFGRGARSTGVQDSR